MFQSSRFISRKSGFTLIEMLIVVAIIGILAGAVLVGLGPVQKGGRDARRVSDLRQAQNALELYFNKNGTYPASSGGTLDSVSAAITASIGGQVPKDPRSPTFNYRYIALSGGSSYVLGATLEDVANKSLQSGSYVSGALTGFPAACGAEGTDNSTPIFMYCITL